MALLSHHLFKIPSKLNVLNPNFMLLPTFLQNSDLKRTIMEQFPGMSLVTADPRHYDEENGRSELQRCSIKGSRYSGFSSTQNIFMMAKFSISESGAKL